MMDEKQTGAALAAKEIVIYEEEHYGKIMPGYPGPDKSAEQQAIEAIILKHCPEDKGVGKLMEVLREIEVEAARAPDCDWMALSGMIVWIKNKVQAALAKYEELKK